jgi:hypothetical protein
MAADFLLAIGLRQPGVVIIIWSIGGFDVVMAIKQFKLAFWISLVVLPAALIAAMSPNSKVSVRNAV